MRKSVVKLISEASVNIEDVYVDIFVNGSLSKKLEVFSEYLDFRVFANAFLQASRLEHYEIEIFPKKLILFFQDSWTEPDEPEILIEFYFEKESWFHVYYKRWDKNTDTIKSYETTGMEAIKIASTTMRKPRTDKEIIDDFRTRVKNLLDGGPSSFVILKEDDDSLMEASINIEDIYMEVFTTGEMSKKHNHFNELFDKELFMISFLDLVKDVFPDISDEWFDPGVFLSISSSSGEGAISFEMSVKRHGFFVYLGMWNEESDDIWNATYPPVKALERALRFLNEPVPDLVQTFKYYIKTNMSSDNITESKMSTLSMALEDIHMVKSMELRSDYEKKVIRVRINREHPWIEFHIDENEWAALIRKIADVCMGKRTPYREAAMAFSRGYTVGPRVLAAVELTATNINMYQSKRPIGFMK